MESVVEMNIEKIRDGVLRIKEKEAALEEYSELWQGCVNLLSYLTELSPKNLRNIRIHTEIFSGEFLNFILFNASSQNHVTYAEGLGYTFATENLAKKYWLSEPPIYGWIDEFGCKHGDVVINPEIARYQLYIENFVNTGMLTQIENSQTKTIIMEIGAGYGAIAHALFNIAPKKICYIVLDLPIMLLYTGCYVATHHPEANIFIYDPDNEDHQHLDDSILDYDLVLIPNHKLSILNKLSKINYVINTISMAEMTMKQVQDYLDFIKPRLINYFYFQNYSWHYPEDLFHFVGQSFLAKPNLSFYDDYIKSKNVKMNWKCLKTFYFCTSQASIDQLSQRKIKLRLPDSRPAYLDLSDESIMIRQSPNQYLSLELADDYVAKAERDKKKRRIWKRVNQLFHLRRSEES